MHARTHTHTHTCTWAHTQTLSRVHCPVDKYTETTGVWWCSRLPRPLAQYHSQWWRWRKQKLRYRICWQWPVLAIYLSSCRWTQRCRHRHAARAFRSTPGVVEVRGDRERCYMNAIALKTAICRTDFSAEKFLITDVKFDLNADQFLAAFH